MNRIEKHLVPRRRVISLLRQSGFDVVSVPPQRHGYDLLVNGHLRVALRVSFPRSRAHVVTARGRRYEYSYPSWHFNFHHHGKLEHQYADFVVCVGMPTSRTADPVVFVIPFDGISGKTFSLLAGRRRYAGRYAKYRDDWASIGVALGLPDAGLSQVA